MNFLNFNEIPILTYHLPEEKIARFPTENRDFSKLLIYEKNTIRSTLFREISHFIEKNSLLIFNNTKVFPARLIFEKNTGAKIEIFLLKPFIPAVYEESFRSKNFCTWECLIGNAKRWQNQTLTKIFDDNILTIEKLNAENPALIRFQWNNSQISFSEIIEKCGKTPLPPYLKREALTQDKENYQTIYAKIDGSVAAPTAGLHFTETIFENLKNKNIQRCELTLHVGAGTFKPISTTDISKHEMHTEHFSISKENLQKFLQFFPKIISVGTTSLRTLESIYWLGVKLLLNSFSLSKNFLSQWEIYSLPQNIETKTAFEAILTYLENEKIENFEGETQLIIVPSYQFRTVKGLITNFHQPQSTLLLLVAAFVGEKWKEIYDFALNNDFRFLSYGDSSLLLK